MTTKDNHNNEDKKLAFYNLLKPTYRRTANDVWEHIEKQIDSVPHYTLHKTPVYKLVLKYAVAAVFLLLMVGVGFIRYYELQKETLKGEHAELLLPDGSVVHLNALSSVSYHPYWWKQNRKVKMAGEAFFEVEKGSKFTVESGDVKTSVLGTSFNVYSRKGRVKVACVTGKVKVETRNDEVVLTPKQKVNYTESKLLEKGDFESANEVNAWIQSEFYYESVPLSDVFKDLELQFDIQIDVDKAVDTDHLKYSGYFKKNHSVENVLNLVSKPFGLVYEETAKGKYRLIYDK